VLDLRRFHQVADQGLHAGGCPVDDVQTAVDRWFQVGAVLQRLRGRLDRREWIAKVVNDHLHDPLMRPPGVVGVRARQVQ